MSKLQIEDTGFKGAGGLMLSKVIVALGSQFLLRFRLKKYLMKVAAGP